MVVILGLSSRPQSGFVSDLYFEYTKALSGLYDENLGLIFEYEKISEYSETIKKHGIAILIVLTGGTRGLIINISKISKYVVIISHGKQNSLASALHALYILRKENKRKRKIVHLHMPPNKMGPDIVREHVDIFKKLADLENQRILLIGVDSEYVSGEKYDVDRLKDVFGISVDTISLSEFIDIYVHEQPDSSLLIKLQQRASRIPKNDLEKIAKIYATIRKTLGKRKFGGIRCFPIIMKTNVTPCIPVSELIDEGIIMACEADLSALVTMLFVELVTNRKSFMGNIEEIDGKKIIVAHCTIACSLVEKYKYVSHFETGYSLAIEGTLKGSDVTLVKISPDIGKIFLAKGKIVESGQISNEFCRTQAVIEAEQNLEKLLAGEFAHHIILVFGDYKDKISRIAKILGLDVICD